MMQHSRERLEIEDRYSEQDLRDDAPADEVRDRSL